MRAEFGYCIICDKETAKQCSSCNNRAANEHYTEVEVEWSNGSKMRIGVCKDCATSHKWATPEAKKGITEAHWKIWDDRHETYSKEIVVV